MADKDRSDIRESETGAVRGHEPETAGQESPEDRARREARRRILIGGLASAPLILTLASRPALAGGKHYGGKCRISGTLSGNQSHANEDETKYCRGKPAKYWKVSENECNWYFAPGPGNPIYQDYYEYKDYSVPSEEELLEYRESLMEYSWNWYKVWRVNQYLEWLDQSPELDETPPFGTLFAEVFGTGIAQDDKLTLMQALWLDEEPPYPPSGNAAPSPLLANIAAAYCNASRYGKRYFGLSKQELVKKVQTDIYSDPIKLEEDLKLLNTQSYT